MLSRQPVLGATALLAALTGAVAAPEQDQPAAGAMPRVEGHVRKETVQDWGRIVVGKRLVLVNNVWNKQAAPAGFRQGVFVAGEGRAQTVGWRWRVPSQAMPSVVSYPEVVCGDKPWDPPSGLTTGFPVRAESKRVTASFRATMQTRGTCNLAFTVWAVSALPASRANITHEIMVWLANRGQTPAGQREGTTRVGDVTYDVHVQRRQRDNSGANSNEWTYVAFVATRPVLRGPVDLSAFAGYLVSRGILSRRSYLTSVELGSEVSNGAGVVQIRDYTVTIK